VRILMVNAHGDDASSGGAEKLVLELSERLQARGKEVALLQAFPAREPVGDFDRTVMHRSDWRDDRIRRVRNHFGDVVSRPSEALQKAVAGSAPDLIHTHNLPGLSTAVWEVARQLGIPVVHSLHDYYLLCPRTTLTHRDATPCRPSPFLCGYRTRRLARWSAAVSHVVGVSQYAIDLHAELFPVAAAHVIRHPLTTDTAALSPSGKGPSTLGYIGSLERIKGVHVLLDAAPRLGQLGVRLRFAGRGRLEEQVMRAAAELGNVEWDGAVLGEEKQRFLAKCDLGVVPSVWAEPGGPTYTVVEWLAARRPVLVSTRGGLGEVAGAYGGSKAIEPNANAVVRAIADLLEPGRWSDLVAAVRPVDSAVEAKQWVDRHVAIYQSALVDPGRAKPGPARPA
jgi:glycosyltransferase involved in cell wall biosynthesis